MSTSGAPKVSYCVDCTTAIIGDFLRCPACHDRQNYPPQEAVKRRPSIAEIVFTGIFMLMLIGTALVEIMAFV